MGPASEASGQWLQHTNLYAVIFFQYFKEQKTEIRIKKFIFFRFQCNFSFTINFPHNKIATLGIFTKAHFLKITDFSRADHPRSLEHFGKKYFEKLRFLKVIEQFIVSKKPEVLWFKNRPRNLYFFDFFQRHLLAVL